MFGGQTTAYTYAPDGARQGKTVGASETFYAGMAEIRDFGTAQEAIILQPHADFRITDAGGAGAAVSYLHRDHLSSVRVITNAAGQVEQSTSYTPYGDPTTANLQASIPEEHSFIGERFDVSTGLLFLNARYYDPALGRFMQPDWWEVRQAGVGTNRYSYSLNDPVNLSDPDGHCPICFAAVAAWFSSSTPANSPGPNDHIVSQSSGETLFNMTMGAFGGNQPLEAALFSGFPAFMIRL